MGKTASGHIPVVNPDVARVGTDVGPSSLLTKNCESYLCDVLGWGQKFSLKVDPQYTAGGALGRVIVSAHHILHDTVVAPIYWCITFNIY